MLFRALRPLFLLTVWFPAVADIPVRPLQVERLPDMSVPRCLHSLYLAPDGSLLAFGGHATGFLPLSSAEVFRGGKWRELPPMHYSHDCGFLFALPEGSILLDTTELDFENSFRRMAEIITEQLGVSPLR